MIPSSPLAKLIAMSLAVVLTGAMMAVGLRPEPVEIAGGAAATEASFGASFADLSVGTLNGDPETELLSSETPQIKASATKPVQSILKPTARIERPETPKAQVPDINTTMTVPLRPTTPVPVVSDEALPSALIEPQQTPQPPLASARAPMETITGEPPQAVGVSIRPSLRPKKVEARGQPAPVPRGNATQTARTGSETGRKAAPAAASSGRGTAQTAGNAAASNYPGQVMARLARVPKPKIRARGTATVSFSVASSGRLAGVKIARSSGSAGLDRAAMRMVQRAAPFPSPPPGAQRSFSVRIAGR